MNRKQQPTLSARSEVRFDAGRHDRAKLGFVLLAMEQTIEEDIFNLAPPGVGVHFSRAPQMVPMRKSMKACGLLTREALPSCSCCIGCEV